MNLLPQRPLALDPRFVASRLGWALAPSLLLAGVGLWALALTAEDATRLLTQDEIAAHGVSAAHPRVEIQRDATLLMFRARRYEVFFADVHGSPHRTTVREHDLSVAPLVVVGPPEVHYDPADEGRVSVGFARQNVHAQWAAVALLGVVGLLGLVGAALALRRLSSPLRAARAAAQQRDERVARVLGSQPSLDSRGAPTGAVHLVLALEAPPPGEPSSYREHGRDSGRARSLAEDPSPRARRAPPAPGHADEPLEVVTAPDDPPLFLDAHERAVLVVTATAGAFPPVLVRRSGHPFWLSPGERAQLDERIAALRGRPNASDGALFCQTPARP